MKKVKEVAGANKVAKLVNGCFGINTETQIECIRVRMRAKFYDFQYRTGREHEKITGRKCNYETVIW